MRLINTPFRYFSATITLIAGLVCSALPALADWREEMGRFRIGIQTNESISQVISHLEPFRLAVEEKLGLPVELKAYSALSRLARAQAGGRLEYAIYPATTYAATWINCECVEPLAVVAAGDGTTASHSILVARRSSDVDNLADLRGKKVWLLAEDGMLTRHYALFRMQVDEPELKEEDIQWLSAEEPRQAIERFMEGEGDALIGWSSLAGDAASGYTRGTLKLIGEEAGGLSGFAVIWQSDGLPHKVHAVRKNVDGEAKSLLRSTLFELADKDAVAYDMIEPVLGGGFNASPHSAFKPAIEFIRSRLPEPEDNATGANDDSISGQDDAATPPDDDTSATE